MAVELKHYMVIVHVRGIHEKVIVHACTIIIIVYAILGTRNVSKDIGRKNNIIMSLGA